MTSSAGVVVVIIIIILLSSQTLALRYDLKQSDDSENFYAPNVLTFYSGVLATRILKMRYPAAK